jgi:hypothetical protein
VSGQIHALAALSLGKNTGPHWAGGWLGLSAGLDVSKKKKLCVPYRIQTRDISGRSLVAAMTKVYQFILIKAAGVQSETSTALTPMHMPRGSSKHLTSF